MLIRHSILLVLALGSLGVQAQETRRVFSSDRSLSIEIPLDWEVQTHGLPPGAVLYAVSPVEGEDDPFQEHLFLQKERLQPGDGLREYIDAFLLGSARDYRNFQLLEASVAELDGYPASYLVNSFHIPGYGRALALSHLQQRGQHAYSVGAMTLESAQQRWRLRLETISRSLRFE